MTITTQPTLSAKAIELLSTAAIIRQRVTSRRLSPWAQELLAAGYLEEQIAGTELHITATGREALKAIRAEGAR